MFNEQFEMLGELLLKSSLITEQQLKQALAEQKSVKKKIGELLIEMNALSEKELIAVLGEQIQIPPADPKLLQSVDDALIRMVPEPFAREHCLIPVSNNGSSVEVAMTDPEDVSTLDQVAKLVGAEVKPLLCGRQSVSDAIDKAYDALRTSGEVDTVMSDLEYEIDDAISAEDVDLSDEAIAASDAPIVKLVSIMLMNAIRDRATDIHIEPRAQGVAVRNRIDGALVKAMTAPIKSHSGIVARIKVMSKLNIAESRLPQDGRFTIKLTDRAVDVRVSILPGVLGEKIVMRLLDKGLFELDLPRLGFSEQDLHIFRKSISLPYGIIIISGPTGSGKSTTLYSALSEIKSEEDNIVTVEDPVEYQMDGITQVATNEKINLTFASALRSILRQDPDKVLIGEIRDRETADIAMKFALTGHLVFTTLHANDTASTITRLIDIGVAPFLAGSSVALVMAQRLVRAICVECKAPYTPTPLEIELLGLSEEERTRPFYAGKGCAHCKQTGYYGRTGIFELMPVTGDIQKLIFENANQQQIKAAAQARNMRSLRQSALEKLFAGVTSVHEVLKRTVEEH